MVSIRARIENLRARGVRKPSGRRQSQPAVFGRCRGHLAGMACSIWIDPVYGGAFEQGRRDKIGRTVSWVYACAKRMVRN